MAVSDDLSQLSTRAKEAEDREAAANTQARENLEQAITTARAGAQEGSDLAHSESAEAAEKARSWGEGVQRSRKAERNAEQAEYNAEDAEDYAARAIDFAYAAIGEAEYAVLDAVLARQDAPPAAGAAGG